MKYKVYNKETKEYEQLSGASLHVAHWWVVDLETGDPMLCIQPVGNDKVEVQNRKYTHIVEYINEM